MQKLLSFQTGRSLAILLGACLAGQLSAALAQTAIPLGEDAAIARAFGNGVHAYYGGDYQRAYESLSDAVAAGSRDPRTLYFRGLASRRMGRIDEAEADFATAARIEAEALGDWPVSRTLERVQGHDRLALERHRVRSRIEVLQERKDTEARRYSQIESVQDQYLRQRRPQGVQRSNAPAFGTPEPVPAPPVPVEPGRVDGAEQEAEADRVPPADDGDF